MREITQTVYKFSELSDKAKKKVIERFIEKEADDYFDTTEIIKEQFSEKVKEKGYPTDNIQWSLNCCQGDGVAIYCKPTVCNNILKRLGVDCSEEIVLEIRQRGHYDHYNSMEVVLSSDEIKDRTLCEWEVLIAKDLKDLSIELEKAGYDIIECNHSEKAAIDFLTESDREYFVSGREYIE